MFSIQFHSCNWTTPPTGADDTHSVSHWWQTLCPPLRTSPVQCAASCLCTGWWETGRTTALMRAVNWERLGYELKGHNGSPRMGRKKPRRTTGFPLSHSTFCLLFSAQWRFVKCGWRMWTETMLFLTQMSGLRSRVRAAVMHVLYLLCKTGFKKNSSASFCQNLFRVERRLGICTRK